MPVALELKQNSSPETPPCCPIRQALVQGVGTGPEDPGVCPCLTTAALPGLPLWAAGWDPLTFLSLFCPSMFLSNGRQMRSPCSHSRSPGGRFKARAQGQPRARCSQSTDPPTESCSVHCHLPTESSLPALWSLPEGLLLVVLSPWMVLSVPRPSSQEPPRLCTWSADCFVFLFFIKV